MPGANWMSTERPHLQGPEERKIGLIRNPVSLIGAALAATSLATIAFLFFVNFVSVRPSPYIGVLLFMVAPAFLILGLVLILLGLLLGPLPKSHSGSIPCPNSWYRSARSSDADENSYVR
jgi:hypothetical protein